MKNVRLLKKPGFFYLLLIAVISFCCYSCDPDKYDPNEHDEDDYPKGTSSSTDNESETYSAHKYFFIDQSNQNLLG